MRRRVSVRGGLNTGHLRDGRGRTRAPTNQLIANVVRSAGESAAADVAEEDPAKGAAHEAVDGEVDAAVEGHEEVGDGGAQNGPLGNAVAAVADALADDLEGRQFVDVQDDAKGVADQEQKDDDEEDERLEELKTTY